MGSEMCIRDRILPETDVPVRRSNLLVTRVSSQAMISAFDSVSAARAEKSPRLPIGVATMLRIPVRVI